MGSWRDFKFAKLPTNIIAVRKQKNKFMYTSFFLKIKIKIKMHSHFSSRMHKSGEGKNVKTLKCFDHYYDIIW